MTAAGLFYLALFLIYAIGSRFGLSKLFEKAGEKGWKAWVPVYSDLPWLKMIGKPAWWIVLTLIPVVRTLVKVSMDIDMARVFGKHGFGQQALAVILPFYFYPKIGLDKETAYRGVPLSQEEAEAQWRKDENKDAAVKAPGLDALSRRYHMQPKRSGGREWADAFLFAGMSALIIRTFMIEAFIIPTSSMERTLMAGDYLFVSKYHYGVRMPMTPLTVPFVHNKIKLGGFSMKSYLGFLQLPYYRLPGLSQVQRNDIIVFNYPAHDIDDLQDGAGLVRHTSMKENYIKRCVAVAGDSLSVRNGQVFIGQEQGYNPPGMQGEYYLTTKDRKPGFSWSKMREMGFRVMKDSEPPMSSAENPNWGKVHPGFVFFAPDKVMDNFRNNASTDSLFQYFEEPGERRPMGAFDRQDLYPLYPNTRANQVNLFPWNADNFGPLWVPARGATLDLSNQRNYWLYKRVIEAYEGHELKWNNGAVLDGQPVKEYTFRYNYYFAMGDNRHNSEDSRFWGFVPETHIVGKPLMVFFSYEKAFGVRLNRIGTHNTK